MNVWLAVVLALILGIVIGWAIERLRHATPSLAQIPTDPDDGVDFAQFRATVEEQWRRGSQEQPCPVVPVDARWLAGRLGSHRANVVVDPLPGWKDLQHLHEDFGIAWNTDTRKFRADPTPSRKNR